MPCTVTGLFVQGEPNASPSGVNSIIFFFVGITPSGSFDRILDCPSNGNLITNLRHEGDLSSTHLSNVKLRGSKPVDFTVATKGFNPI